MDSQFFSSLDIIRVNKPRGIRQAKHAALTNFMELSTIWEATSFPAFYGAQRFNTEFIRALHLFLS
jgi:hypothetical protein